MTAPAMQRADLSAQNPWPGLRAFTESDRDFFFGRERETAELLSIVKRAPVVVLYGQSGLGKTSLLQAGLFPELKKSDFVPFRLRFDHEEGAPSFAEQIKQALVSELDAAQVDVPRPSPNETLWEYFHRRDVDFWGPRNRLCTPVIVLDQFEEVFTVGQASDKSAARVAQFAADLESVIEHRPPDSVRERLDAHPEEALAYDFQRQPVKFVLSLREDFLPQLDPWRSRMPSLLPNRFRLERMTATQALSVIEKGGRDLVDAEVAREIVEFVSSSQRKQATRSMERRDVEPALLSVVCEELNRRRLERNQPRITTDLFTEEQSGIIQSFYERAFDGIDRRVRDWVEDELLTASGYRDRAALEDALNLGLPQRDFGLLVDRRVLHREERDGVVWLELTHDLLTDPAARSRTEREQRLREEAIATREADQKEKLRRTRAVVAVMGLLLIVSLALSLFALYQSKLLAEKSKKLEGLVKDKQAAIEEEQRALKGEREASADKDNALRAAQSSEEKALKEKARADTNAARADGNAKRADANAAMADENAKRADANAATEKATAEQLANQRKITLESANAGLEAAREAGGKALEVMKKSKNDNESLETYLGIIEVADNYADTILTLDPTNRAAMNMKGFNYYFRADTLRRLDKKPEAAKAIKDGMHEADVWASSSDPWTQVIAARTYGSLALAAMNLADDKEADANISHAIASAQTARSHAPEKDYEIWHYLAMTYNVVASVDYDNENWNRAIVEYFHESEMETKAFVSAVQDDQKVATKHDSLTARLNIARVNIKRKRYDNAQHTLELIEKDAKDFVVKVQNLKKKDAALETKFMNDLWTIQDVLADTLAAQRKTWSLAEPKYQEALETGEKTLKLDSGTANVKRRESETQQLAVKQTLLGRYPEAKVSYERYISLIKNRASGVEPDPEQQALDLAWGYRMLADFEENHGQKTDALAERQKELETLRQAGSGLYANMRTSSAYVGEADLLASLGRTKAANQAYREAIKHCQDAAQVNGERFKDNPYQAQSNFETIYDRWAMAKLGSGDRDGAREYLQKTLAAVLSVHKLAEAERAKKETASSREKVRSTSSALGWFELLNNHPQESLAASQEALKINPDDALVKENLAHANLNQNHIEQAKTLYLANRGEEVNRDAFEFAVRDDFRIFRKLGMGLPEMAEIEKLLGIQE